MRQRPAQKFSVVIDDDVPGGAKKFFTLRARDRRLVARASRRDIRAPRSPYVVPSQLTSLHHVATGAADAGTRQARELVVRDVGAYGRNPARRGPHLAQRVLGTRVVEAVAVGLDDHRARQSEILLHRPVGSDRCIL